MSFHADFVNVNAWHGGPRFNVTMTVDGEMKTLSASEQLAASRALGAVQHEDHHGHDWIITLRDATQHPLLSS